MRFLLFDQFPYLHQRGVPAGHLVPVADQFHVFIGIGIVCFGLAGVDKALNRIFSVAFFQERVAHRGQIVVRNRIKPPGNRSPNKGKRYILMER